MSWLRTKIPEFTSDLIITVKNWFYSEEPSVQALKEQVAQLKELITNLAVKIQIYEQEREAIHNVARTLQQPIAHKLPHSCTCNKA